MGDAPSAAESLFRARFAEYRRLADLHGDEFAWEKMLEGYPERQRQRMGPLIANGSLAAGFTKAIPLFRQFGMTMEVIDISSRRVDAVLEVQRTCPVSAALCKEFGFDTPCRVVCEMDIEATKRAFAGMNGAILCNQADGDCVCVFKYERASDPAS